MKVCIFDENIECNHCRECVNEGVILVDKNSSWKPNTWQSFLGWVWFFRYKHGMLTKKEITELDVLEED